MGAMHVAEFVAARPRYEESSFRLYVIYTTPEATRAGLRFASLLARDLGAKLELLVPKVVPYPRPLHDPTISAAFTEDLLTTLVSECDVDVHAKVLLCRDREETIPRWLPSKSITVIARCRQWGPGSAWGLIRLARRNGHHVIVVDAGPGKAARAHLYARRMVR